MSSFTGNVQFLLIKCILFYKNKLRMYVKPFGLKHYGVA